MVNNSEMELGDEVEILNAKGRVRARYWQGVIVGLTSPCDTVLVVTRNGRERVNAGRIRVVGRVAHFH